MCGIAGWVDYASDLRDREDIAQKMAATLLNRGPDEGGTYRQQHAWLVHRRLAVVDPAHGKQPMKLDFQGRSYCMAYNGELYNTPELRRELTALGHQLNEQSDTEVLLHAYAQWGAACLQRLNGIYAFAVWEPEQETLFLARDRMGVKPLFFYPTTGGLVFGSQLKTLLAHPAVEPVVDMDGLRELFFMGPGRSFGQGVIRGVKELLPGEYLTLSRNGMKRETYWQVEAAEFTDTPEMAIEKTRYLVTDAIRRQLVSDVPLCTFLSGGLDSSLISKVAADQYRDSGKRLTTYSVDYEDNAQYFKKSLFQPNSDNTYIEMMRDFIGSEHRWVTLNNTELAAALPDAMRARDLPGMADIDSSLLLFCRQIKQDFTVAVSGECADEIFGGYPWYHNEEILFEECFPWSRLLDVRRSILRPGAVPQGEEYVHQKYLDTLRTVSTLPGDSPLEKRMREMTMLNLRWFMQTLLDRKDRMSMDCGLEVRVPFCDHRIVEYAYNMPWSIKSRDGREKGILREAVTDLLPYDIVWRKKSPYPKTHNPVFMELVSNQVRDILKDKHSIAAQFLDPAGVEQIIGHPDSLPGNWYGQLMNAPQILAYIIQLDGWFKDFGIKLA